MSTVTVESPKRTRLPFLQKINARLRNRILLGVLLLSILAAIVGAVAIISQIQETAIINRVIDTDSRITQLDSRILQTLTNVEVVEQSILQVVESQGVDLARAEFLNEWQSAIQQIRLDLVEIDSLQEQRLVDIANGQDGMVTDEIARSLGAYEQNFLAYLDLLEQRGIGTTGYTGEFGATADTFGTAIRATGNGDLQIAFLQIENLERQYELTQNQATANEVEELMYSMHDVIAQADITDVEKALVDGLLMGYHEAFNLIVATNNEADDLRVIYKDALGRSEQLVEETLTQSLIGAEVAEGRVTDLVTQRTIIIALLSAVAIVAGIVFARVISNRLTNQMDALLRFFDALDREEIDTRAEIVSEDELSEVAVALNEVLDEQGKLIQTTEQRAALAVSIGNLIDDMQRTASGDLRKETVVSADMTGAIADSFNLMVEQLRDVIRQVQDTSFEVSSSATRIESTATALAQRSDAQAAQILDTTSEIDAMSIAIQQVSSNASVGASIGQQTNEMSLQGSQIVTRMMDGLAEVHSDIRETEQRLNTLSTETTELAAISKLISNITQRTSVLALNASIQASSAGSEGRRFLNVAAQVDELAEQSADATREINRQLRTIQSEAKAALSEVLETQTEVRAGMRLANEANSRLEDVEAVAIQLAELISSISLATQQQVRGTEDIARSMNEIAGVTQQTANRTREATSSMQDLAATADNLKTSVDRFVIEG